ncbi:MAG TPA: DoxX family protein, partial [Cytophagaceae bacterium]
HGVPKLNKALSGNMQFSDPFGVGAEISLGLAIFSELICSIFVFIGLGTRLASVPLIITMFVAGFIVHGDDPFKKKELALMYLLIYLVLFIAGSGKYSVDRLLKK